MRGMGWGGKKEKRRRKKQQQYHCVPSEWYFEWLVPLTCQ
jgi:hypothetical protein